MKVVLYGSPVTCRCGWLASELGKDFEVTLVDYSASDAEKAAAIKGAAAMVAVRYDLQGSETSTLRLVQVPGIGCDEVQFDLLPAGATLCNVRGHEAGVAEYVILQMLEWYHRAGEAAEEFRAGSWARSSRFGARPHRELAGSVVGIVGYGAIGRALSIRLRALDTRVLVANRTPLNDPSAVDGSFGLHQIEAMFEACDFGVLAVGLTKDTRGLIEEKELAALGPTGVLINVARAAVVDEDALWAYLSDGRLGGAVLDVWYRYPDEALTPASPSRHPLLGLKNVVGTPHMAGWTEGTVKRRWNEIAENIRRIGTGRAFLNVVRASQDV